MSKEELTLEERFNLRYPSGSFAMFMKNYPNTNNRNDPNGLLDAFEIPRLRSELTKEQLELLKPSKPKQKTTWLDVFLGNYRWYRKLRKGHWHLHRFTKDAEELTFPQGKTFWARYGEINRYSEVIRDEFYKQKQNKDERYN